MTSDPMLQNRRGFPAFDFAGPGPAHIRARNDRRPGPVVVVHDTDVLPPAFLKVAFLKVSGFMSKFFRTASSRLPAARAQTSARLIQGTRSVFMLRPWSGSALDPVPDLRPANGLHRPDACFAAPAPIRKGLQYVHTMEHGSLMSGAADHNRVFDWRICGEFDLGFAEVERYGRSPA